MGSVEKAKEFLKISDKFRLGHLETEGFHPLTKNLSELAKSDLHGAYHALESVDKLALSKLQYKEKEVWELAESIKKVLKSKNKIFMCGCGATGRLSLVLETLFRQKNLHNDQVISFMAGGDFALIKSVESFEDEPSYGERQLEELGFGPNDLLIASTEGGETPFVIGAVNKASEISNISPYFIYCNPDESLRSIDRSEKVLKNIKIKKLNLSVGEMAISGSTRMQASTVIMFAIGVGLLFDHYSEEDFNQFYRDMLQFMQMTSYDVMIPLTQIESQLYKEKTHLNYVAHKNLAISILTDTTERSPTFSLYAFENKLDHSHHHSLSYLFVDESLNAENAWKTMLQREPRPVLWHELNNKVGLDRIYGFDISLNGLNYRESKISCEKFFIRLENEHVVLKCRNEEVSIHVGDNILLAHLLLKMLLNAHSTLIMGILGRYEGNVMTWVKPSNNKLIDRSARYIQEILLKKNKVVSYEEIVQMIFEEIGHNLEERPIVLRVVDRY